MSWLYYLLEANLYLIIFFAFYYLVLRRETSYQYSRGYLLVTSALAFVIPFVQLGMLKPAPVVPTGQPEIAQVSFNMVSTTTPVIIPPSLTKEDYYLAAYLLIACCLLINLAVKIYKLIRLSRLSAYKKIDKWTIVETDENKGAFSFFNYLFVSPEMALSETVIAHELVHIRQKHSWDIVYFELIKVVNWFNPIAYLIQNSIKELHEFIADRAIASDQATIDQYTDFLLGSAYGIHESQLTNNLFNKSLLKKRIMMLHQKRSGNSARLKYLLVLPVSAGLLCSSTLAFAKSYGWIDIAPKHATANMHVVPAAIKSIPTPIPVSHKDWFHYSIDPGRYTTKILSDMAADFKAKGYQMDFRNYKDGNASMLKISLRKSDVPNSGVSNTFKIDELKKTGDVIFLGFNKKRNQVFVYSEKIVLFPKPKQMTNKMPPPPPAEVITNNQNNGIIKSETGKAHTILYEAPKAADGNVTPLIIVNGSKYALPRSLKAGEYLYTHATDSTIQYKADNAYAIQKWGNDAKNGVLELFGKVSVEVIPGVPGTSTTSKVNSEINTEIKNEIDKARDKAAQQNTMPVVDTNMQALYKQIARTTHYPASARENNVTGRVFAVFSVDEDNNIINIGVLRSPDKVMSEEVARVLKNCSGKFKGQTDVTYTLPVSFNIMDERTGKYLDAPGTAPKQEAMIPRDQSIKTKKNIALNEVVVVSYIKQQ